MQLSPVQRFQNSKNTFLTTHPSERLRAIRPHDFLASPLFTEMDRPFHICKAYPGVGPRLPQACSRYTAFSVLKEYSVQKHTWKACFGIEVCSCCTTRVEKTRNYCTENPFKACRYTDSDTPPFAVDSLAPGLRAVRVPLRQEAWSESRADARPRHAHSAPARPALHPGNPLLARARPRFPSSLDGYAASLPTKRRPFGTAL